MIKSFDAELGRAVSERNFHFSSRMATTIGFAILFAFEALIFYAHVAEEIAPFYPRGFDQIGYISSSYQLIEQFRVYGWSAFIDFVLGSRSPTGVLLTAQGALLGLLGGANRASLLTINLLYFFTVQIALFWCIRSRTRKESFAWIGVALLLATNTAFNVAGGIFDYRFDFAAMCLYGVWVCTIIGSDQFRTWKSGLLVSMIAILLFFLRPFTIAYAGLVLVTLVGAFAVQVVSNSSEDTRRRRLEQLRNAFLAGALTLLCLVPPLVLGYEGIYNYYIIGHFLNEEKYIRAAEVGVFTLRDKLLYYPWSLCADHIGAATGVLFFLLIGAVLLQPMRLTNATWNTKFWKHRFGLFVGIVSTLYPLVILTLDLSKSPVVASIVIVPVILTFILAADTVYYNGVLSAVNENARGSFVWFRNIFSGLWGNRLMPLCAGFLAVAIGSFIFHNAKSHHGLSRPDLDRVKEINTKIVQFILDSGLRNPKASFDRVEDFLNPGTIDLYAYETVRRPTHVVPGYMTIFAIPRDDALNLFQSSDVIVLSDRTKRREHPYPMNAKIQEYWDEINTLAADRFKLLLSTSIAGLPFKVFVKPTLHAEGISGDWITSFGISVQVDPADLVQWPLIVVEGSSSSVYLKLIGGSPGVTASASSLSAGGTAIELPVDATFTDGAYRLIIDARAIAAKGSEPKQVDIRFDRHFVPKAVGMNPDTRELVLPAPSRLELRASR